MKTTRRVRASAQMRAGTTQCWLERRRIDHRPGTNGVAQSRFAEAQAPLPKMFDEHRLEYLVSRAQKRVHGSAPTSIEEPTAVRTATSDFLEILSAIFLVGVGVALFQLGRRSLYWLWSLLEVNARAYWLHGVVAIAVLATGCGFYVFRERRPMFYGLVEIGFGAAGGVYAVLIEQKALGVAGAVYLVVRGLDNMNRRRSAGMVTPTPSKTS